MATYLPPCFFIQFLEQLLKFLVNFTLLKYDKSQRSNGFLITKELIFGFQILDSKDRFSASLICFNLIIHKRNMHRLPGGGGGLLPYIGIQDVPFFRVLFGWTKINFWVKFLALNKFLGQIVMED